MIDISEKLIETLTVCVNNSKVTVTKNNNSRWNEHLE